MLTKACCGSVNQNAFTDICVSMTHTNQRSEPMLFIRLSEASVNGKIRYTRKYFEPQIKPHLVTGKLSIMSILMVILIPLC